MRNLACLLAAPLVFALTLAVPPSGPGAPGAASAASFDCAKAATPTERAICANAKLSALDTRLGATYDQRLALDPGIRQIQRAWLVARNVGCGGDAVCLSRFMSAELAWFAGGGSRPPSDLPTKPGACSLTSITQIGTRLDNTPGSGSSASEANTGYQVSYDTIAAIDQSRIGDPALVCLVRLPQNCPAGDDRGKIYAVGNLRTLGAWSESDSEHDCGGA